MIDEVSGIKIKGANFECDTELQVYESDKEFPISIVYGKNGSGKSTISRAFNSLKGNTEATIQEVEAINKDNAQIELSYDEKQNILIFNEDYVDMNIRIREDGLNAIVVIGERKELEDQIKDAEKKVNDAQEKSNKQKEICDKYNDESQIISPQCYMGKIVLSLKGDENWAGRDCKIKGNRTASQVRTDTYKQFILRTPSKSRDELIKDFEEKIRELQEAKSGSRKIEPAVKTDFILAFNEKEFERLLAKKIEKPELSEREKFLLSYVAERGHEKHTVSVKDYFELNENTICPFCLQSVNENYKEELFASIEKILSKKAKDHQKELKEYIRTEFEYDLNKYDLLDSNKINECKQIMLEINLLIKENNTKIENKCSNLYLPITISLNNILNKFDLFIEKLVELEDLRIEYNKNALDISTKIEALNTINYDIAYYDIKDNYDSYQKQEKIKKNEDMLYAKLLEDLELCNKKFQELIEKKKNAKIALDFINDGLKYIFFSNSRLTIEYRNDQYILKSRNKPVTPKKISVGERNAIALCYFFSNMMLGKDENKIYLDKYMLIIDDPVSSFDMGNRIGILSYLKYQMQRIAIGNSKTKMLIMTHDIQTFYDLHKVAKEVITHCGGKTDGKKSSLKLLELQNNAFDDFNMRDRNEYTCLLEKIFDYANGNFPEYEIAVGNSMRRILEAFSTFSYKMGIEEISTDKKILDKLDKPYGKYFENLMYRLVLHGGSHYKDHINAMGNSGFFDCISSEEKCRTARDVICFIYCLNDAHVLEHLSHKENTKESIETWMQNIKELGVV